MLTGLLMFRAHPLLGVGPGAFEVGLQRFGPQIFGLWDYVASAHNLYIHMAAETGLVGLAALLGFLVTIFLVLLRSARREGGTSAREAEERSLRRAILWSFTTACVVGFFEWPFAHGVAELIMIVSAMGCALARRSVA
jgi:O-antigen ligase